MQAETLPNAQMFIGGAWVPSHSGRNYPLFNPATGQVLAHVPKGDAEDVKAAVDAAERAFQTAEWRRMDPSKRGRLLNKVAQGLRDRLADFAKLETLNNGKPLGQAKGDIAMAARHFEYFAGLADKIQGSTIPVPGNRLDYTVKEPLGVTAHVVPWNYPLVMAARSMAPALAAGNTVVAKPASFTPLTLLRFAELCKQAGIPDGVVNVVTGGGDEVGGHTGKAPGRQTHGPHGVGGDGDAGDGARVCQPFESHLGARREEPPHRLLRRRPGERGRRGAERHIHAMQARCAGQARGCSSRRDQGRAPDASRRRGECDEGRGRTDPETAMGPLVAESQRERVAKYVEIGVGEGAQVAAGGKTPEDEGLKGGYFYRPTVLDGVTQDMKVAQEEIFGPVLTVTTFEGQEDAVAKANDSEYGLWAGIWTRDLRRAHTVARDLESGIVAVNEEPTTFPQTPFGGFKNSGNASEQGMDAVSAYVRVKNVSVNLG